MLNSKVLIFNNIEYSNSEWSKRLKRRPFFKEFINISKSKSTIDNNRHLQFEAIKYFNKEDLLNDFVKKYNTPKYKFDSQRFISRLKDFKINIKGREIGLAIENFKEMIHWNKHHSNDWEDKIKEFIDHSTSLKKHSLFY